MCKCNVLYGRANVGKTTSLELVIEKLVANGAKEIKGLDDCYSELPGDSKDYLRQEMKKLVDEERLMRLYNGVYYLPYTTILWN